MAVPSAHQQAEQPARDGAACERFRAFRRVEAVDDLTARVARVAGRAGPQDLIEKLFRIDHDLPPFEFARFACESPVTPASAGGRGPPVAQSSNSTVCTMVAPPAASCVMQPTLPVATTSARASAMCVSLRSRKRVASCGCKTLYVPAEPQQRCPSAISLTANPAAASNARGGCSTFCPCCIEHAE